MIFQQIHYGFSNLISFRSYMKKFAVKTFAQRNRPLGIEAMLANLLCRTTLLPEIRAAYLLVKAGGVMVDETITKNPRRMLSLTNVIKIEKSYKRILMRYYKLWLRRRKVVAGIMGYFDYNFKLMTFKI